MYSFKAPSKKKRRKIIKSFEENSDDNDVDNNEYNDNNTTTPNDDATNQKNQREEEDDDDDNSDNHNNITIKKRVHDKKFKKKSKHSSKLSFSHDDDDDDGDEEEDSFMSKRSSENKQKKKKKRLKGSTSSGMGFGGGMIASHLNSNYDDEGEENMDDATSAMNGVTKQQRINSQRFGITPLESIIHDDEDIYVDEQQKEKDNDNSKGHTNNNDNISTSLYGKEALAKLKAQQKTFTSPPSSQEKDVAQQKQTKDNTITSNSIGNDDSNNYQQQNVPLPPLPSTTVKPKPPQQRLDHDLDEDFIPLDSSSSSKRHNILTGDEALLHVGEMIDDDDDHFGFNGYKKQNVSISNLGTETLSNIPKKTDLFMENLDDNEHENDDGDIDEGGRQWEAEIARRAGVGLNDNNKTGTPSFSSTHSSSHQQDKQVPTRENSKLVITNVKNTMKVTLENLHEMELDLESNVGRRTHDQQISQDDVEKKETELKEVGEKFEYYQNLRLEMVNWIGALRHISERVGIVEEAIIELYRDVARNHERSWREWEDDVVATLVEREYLDYIVGRQPEVPSKKEENTIDEFGRDVSILNSIDRKNRNKKRCRVRAESKDRWLAKNAQRSKSVCEEAQSFEDSDLDVSDNELYDIEERRRVYCDAVNLVLNETDEDYSTPINLLSTFQLWKGKHNDDYSQCYATLTLIDLISVFVKIENCQNIDLLCFIKEKLTKNLCLDRFSWYKALQQFKVIQADGNDHQFTNSIIAKIVAKQFGDLFLSMLFHPGKGIGCYNLLLANQTNSMTAFCKMIFVFVDEEEKLWRENICSSVVQHINNYVQNLAIPVLNNNIKGHDDDEIIIFSTLGQLVRLRKIVYNITKWNDILTNHEQIQLAKLCLMDVIAYRFLPILNISTMILRKGLIEEALNLLEAVWKCVKEVGWLEVSDLIMSSAPLRSVVTRYTINN